MRGFGFFLGFSRGGGGAISAWAGYLLNALGFNTGSSAQTLTAPDPVLALDWEGTLTDFGGAVNASGDSVAPPVGSRLVTTVADGAVLGSEANPDPTFDSPGDWSVEPGAVVTTGFATWTTANAGTDVARADALDIGAYYTAELVVDSVGVGGIKMIVGSTGSVIATEAGTYNETIQAIITDDLKLRASATPTTAVVSSFSVKQVLPTVLDTDTSSTPLHPSVTTGGVTDYVFYPTHEVSTAYASDKFVWAEASDGSTRYYSSSGGTSAASAPTFPTSGTVVDNDITWTYEGRYGLSGQRVEFAASNYLLNSDSPATQTTGSLTTGTYTCWIEDGDTGSATVSAGTATITGGGAASDGSDLTFEVTGAGTVTVTVAGAVSFFQLEGSDFRTSHIVTAGSTITRSVVNLKTVVSDTNLGTDDGAARLIITPLGTGQAGKIMASYTDASNELSVDFTATTITLNKTVAGSTDTATKTYTHADGEQIVIDFAYGSGGMSINSFVVGATAGSAGTNAATTAAVLGTNIQFGASNDAGHINATFDTAIRSYATEAQASADIADWSL